jgi:hypothetical protein
MTQIHPVDSPDRSARASEGSAIAQATITTEKVKGWLLPLVLALSIAGNIWAALVIRDYGTEQRLKQYNLDWFKTHEFSDLKAEVEVNQKLITAFGPQQCKR